MLFNCFTDAAKIETKKVLLVNLIDIVTGKQFKIQEIVLVQAAAHEQLQRQMLLERDRFPPHPSIVAQHEEYLRSVSFFVPLFVFPVVSWIFIFALAHDDDDLDNSAIIATIIKMLPDTSKNNIFTLVVF